VAANANFDQRPIDVKTIVAGCHPDDVGPQVSVLIVTRNRLSMLQRCLASVWKQCGVFAEVLVLDNQSTEPLGPEDLRVFESHFTGEAAVSPRPAVPVRSGAARFAAAISLQLIRSETNLGVAPGRNLLIARSRAPFMVFIDDDAVFPSPDALRRVVDHFEEAPIVAALAFNVRNVYGDGAERPFVPFSRRKLRERPSLVDSACLVSYFVGAGHALRRAAIDRCGHLEETFFYGEEELDLSYRLVAEGFQIRFAADIAVCHYPQPTLLGRKRPELHHHARNRFVLAKRYIEPWRWPIYLAVWQSRLLWDALRSKALLPLVVGWGEGITAFLKSRRVTLGTAARRYLLEHHGRRWY